MLEVPANQILPLLLAQLLKDAALMFLLVFPLSFVERLSAALEGFAPVGDRTLGASSRVTGASTMVGLMVPRTERCHRGGFFWGCLKPKLPAWKAPCGDSRADYSEVAHH